MFDLKIPQAIKNYAWALVSAVNFGQRGKADGSKEQQYTGMIGEVMCCDLFRRPRPQGGAGPDPGHDMVISEKRVDVKTMGRTVPMQAAYVHNFCALQIRAPGYYLFCSICKPTSILTVCGTISAAELHQKGQHFAEGETRTRSDGTTFVTRAGMIEVAQASLAQCRDAEDIQIELMDW